MLATGRRVPGFLELLLSANVCMHVCVVDIDSGHDVSIHTRHGNYLNKSELALYKPLLHYYHLKHL